MRRDNKHLANQLSSALEELKNLRASELFELEKQKRQLYGRKSEKAPSLLQGTDKDLKNDKDDFDGSNPPIVPTSNESSTTAASDMNIDLSSSTRSTSKPCRSDYSKRSTRVDNVVMHYCDESGTPSDARKFEYRKKYIWGIKNLGLKVAYYLYDRGSRSMEVAQQFFKNFFGSITTRFV